MTDTPPEVREADKRARAHKSRIALKAASLVLSVQTAENAVRQARGQLSDLREEDFDGLGGDMGDDALAELDRALLSLRHAGRVAEMRVRELEADR